MLLRLSELLGFPFLVVRSLLFGLRLGPRVREILAPSCRAQRIPKQEILNLRPGKLPAPGRPRLRRPLRLEAKVGEALPQGLVIKLLAQQPQSPLGRLPQALQGGLVAAEERTSTSEGVMGGISASPTHGTAEEGTSRLPEFPQQTLVPCSANLRRRLFKLFICRHPIPALRSARAVQTRSRRQASTEALVKHWTSKQLPAASCS